MKELLFKFESEEDYNKFIKEVILPEVLDEEIEYDSSNNIVIVKKLKDD